MKIITAFKSGGIYDESHVERLRRQVNLASGHDLECIYGEYPHWWCKMNIFQVEGPVLYMDLDTTIVDDLTPLIEAAKEERFIALRDFNYPKRVQSSVMAWNGDMSHIYDEFIQEPDMYMDMYPGGDQSFIDEGNHCPAYWQDILPNSIQSFKVNVRNSGIHPDCCVVAFHGNPRPWAISELIKEK